MTEQESQVASALRNARSVVVITGAGVSAESGLRTFRGGTGAKASELPKDMQALWKEFDPARLATPEAFEADPEMVSRWYDWRRLGCLAAEPNPGHIALAAIERELAGRGGRFTLLTQNVDRLHHRAGSRNVVELHGTIMVWRCCRTGREVEPGPEAQTEFPPRSPFSSGAIMRPSVVWFGEMLPESALSAAAEAMDHLMADEGGVFMSIGTSSVVYPAAAYVEMAAMRGVATVEINPEPTAISGRVDWSIRGKSGEVLPRVVAAAFAG